MWHRGWTTGPLQYEFMRTNTQLILNQSSSSPLSLFSRFPPSPFWAVAPKGAMSYRIGGFCAYVRTSVRLSVRPPSQASGA